MLHNAVGGCGGGGGGGGLAETSVTNVYRSTLLVLRLGGGGQISRKKALHNTC